MIAHRLQTITAADHIVPLDDGHAAEQGTHDQLIAAGGRYAAFWADLDRARGRRITAAPATTR